MPYAKCHLKAKERLIWLHYHIHSRGLRAEWSLSSCPLRISTSRQTKSVMPGEVHFDAAFDKEHVFLNEHVPCQAFVICSKWHVVPNMQSVIIILGAILPYLATVSADPCFKFDENAHPLQWKDIGGDEIRQRYVSNVCGLISINDDWHEEGKESKVRNA